MIKQNKERLRHFIRIEFVRFSIVGGVGFLINLFLLYILNRIIGVPIFISQLIGAEVSLFSNFMLHHHWTYKSHNVNKSVARLLVQFHATSWPAILGSALMVTAGRNILHLSDLFALVISSFIALAWNFAWTKYIIWKNISPNEIERISK
jgi:dolichol-phosphate mannosyltransferase